MQNSYRTSRPYIGSFVILVFFFLFFSCQKEPEPINQPPHCEILTYKLKEVKIKDSVTIKAYVYDNDGEINMVNFFIDSNPIGSATTDPYQVEWYVDPDLIGYHTIKATAIDNLGETTSDETEIEVIGIAPLAEFEANKTAIFKGESVTFTDKSINTPTNWLWKFGDRNTSTEQNPTHIYKLAGTYKVSLTASNTYGENIISKEDYMEVSFDYGLVTDYDGNTYKTVKIGEQEWMAENLKVTHYPNGNSIPHITDVNDWKALEDNNTDDAFCYVKNDVNYGYGAYYTWAAAMGGDADRLVPELDMVQGACPNGWHLPNRNEWDSLFEFIRNDCNRYDCHPVLLAKDDLQEYGEDLYGFSAQYTGYRGASTGYEYDSRRTSSYWTSTNPGTSDRTTYILLSYSLGCQINNLQKSSGVTIRCVKN